MIEIKDLLLKFSNLILKEEVKREVTRTVISEVIHYDIKPEEIKIKNNIIYLNIKPIYKSQILIKKEEIFNKLKENFTSRTPNDIR